jgi:hypothetical protein
MLPLRVRLITVLSLLLGALLTHGCALRAGPSELGHQADDQDAHATSDGVTVYGSISASISHTRH